MFTPPLPETRDRVLSYMTTANHHFNIRIDRATSESIKRLALRERKSISDVAREALRARLEVGSMIEPLRIAIADATALMTNTTTVQIHSAIGDGVARLQEAGAQEREQVRSMISDFLAGLQSVMGGEPVPTPPASSDKPLPIRAPRT